MNIKIFIRSTIIAVMTVASTPLLASNWQVAEVSTDERLYFFDADSVEKSKDSVLVWIKTVEIIKAHSEGHWALAFRWKMNCTRKTVQTLASSRYDQEGTFLTSNSGPFNERLVLPDSTGEAILKIACKANFPNDTSGKDYSKVEGNDIFQFTKYYALTLK